MNLDITALAHVVRRFDISATLKAFVAVLAPLLVLTNLTALLGMVRVFLSEDLDFREETAGWVAIVLLAVIFSFAPLGFIFSDWAARKDNWRHLSAITGALLGYLGFTAVGALLGLGPLLAYEALEDADLGPPQRLLVAIFALVLVWAGAWLTVARKWIRTLLVGIPILLALLIVGGIAVILWRQGRTEIAPPGGEASSPVASWMIATAAVGFLVWWLVRSVRLRIVLCGDHPRALLLGDLHQKGFWVRMAFLAGLPSALWNLSAMRTLSFWGFLASRPLVYGGSLLAKATLPAWHGMPLNLLAGLVVIVAGHYAFFGAKRLAARKLWIPSDRQDPRPPILLLRSFQDDQLQLKQPWWNLIGRWFDLWSFRSNADEVLMDEIAQYGPIVALGRPGESKTPFGAMRYYANHDEWRDIILDTARKAQAIVVCAGESEGIRWEYEMLVQENLLDRTLILFRPAPPDDPTSRLALENFHRLTGTPPVEPGNDAGCLISLASLGEQPTLLRANTPMPAAYVVAIRAYFQKCRHAQLREFPTML